MRQRAGVNHHISRPLEAGHDVRLDITSRIAHGKLGCLGHDPRARHLSLDNETGPYSEWQTVKVMIIMDVRKCTEDG